MQDVSWIPRVQGRPSALAAEPELLFRCAATRLDDLAEQRVYELSSGPIDWDRVVRLARRHRVVPLLYSNLKRFGSPPVPTVVLSDLRQQFLANAARNLQLAHELQRLLDALEREKIAAVPFKGLALAAFAYGNTSLREAGDLDLLVRRDDIPRAIDVLESMGHRPFFPTSTPREAEYLTSLAGPSRIAYLRSHSEHHLIHRDGMVNVDVHWAIALREFALPIDTTGIWQRLTRVSIAGRSVRALATEDLLLVLCVNGAKDCWERLDRVCDVAELLRRNGMDWDGIFAAAERTGAMRILLLGLRLASQLLGAPVPPQAGRRMRRDGRLANLAAQIQFDLLADDPACPEPSRPGRLLFQLRLRERRRDQARYCLAQLRPGVGDWASFPLPAGLSFLYYLIRPIRLLTRYVVLPVRPSGPASEP